MYTAPMTAASSSTLTTSNGSMKSANSVWASFVVFVQIRAPASGQSVAATVTAIRRASTAAAIAAGRACVWNTSEAGPAFVWVSMIANRISTLMAPM